MDKVIDRVLVSEEDIRVKVKELGERISKDYQDKDLLVVGILKGALVFMADLIRAIHIPIEIDFMAVSSYGAGAKSSGAVRILKDLDRAIENRHILIVEDIVDTGLTLNYLMDNLKSRGAASVKVCTALDKPSRRKTLVTPDYNGFTIPDEFVIGYGLDYAEQYRHFPFVAVLKREVYEK
ncbi:hypoxanthine phosphoribosyltransferase [Heliomicrobium modesticaldum Ice1]|uniref:Hypoxanthine phosphoribosyltransferase n=1 Tax=Heliobacterium modesticaldum (strain ATCC 51547 / Ice1) TaxID=498761 RepID=B0TI10_HELMI|nr:hypoxanthine phosphoribosyltransferase [Heliomicrobium modesticaldum]ABZ82683.1 hypoxanthine phosphoribosyltransferase [Heliomicrobium modesticaldum Ice1]